MSQVFDAKGVWGPATTLIFSECDVDAVASMLTTNYEQLSCNHTVIEPSVRENFCTTMKTYQLTSNEIVATPFFSAMQAGPTAIHDRVKTILIPAMLKQTPNVNSELVTDPVLEWLTSFVESYLSESQLQQNCDLQEMLSNKDLNRERARIGMSLYQQVSSKTFSEADLNALLSVLLSDHPDTVIEYAQQYQTFFALAGEHSSELRDSICSSLDTTFRSKFFP